MQTYTSYDVLPLKEVESQGNPLICLYYISHSQLKWHIRSINPITLKVHMCIIHEWHSKKLGVITLEVHIHGWHSEETWSIHRLLFIG